MSDQYVSKKVVDASYRPKSYEMSPGLKRARAPFRVRNAITGTLIATFAVGVWAYSISAVKQDNFDDVDEEAKALARSGVRSTDEKTEGTRAAASSNLEGQLSATGNIDPQSLSSQVSQQSSVASTSNFRGVLVPILERRFPRLLDPVRKTFIWGAPPVDDIGRMRDERN